MKTMFYLIIFALLCSGCANANRTHLDAGEGHYDYKIQHCLEQHPAFLKVQQSLAEINLGSASLTQSAGYILMHPLISYQVGGQLGEVEYARCTLRVKVTDSTVKLEFDLGPADNGGWTVYPPRTDIPIIPAKFDAIATVITGSVNGAIENSKPVCPKNSGV